MKLRTFLVCGLRPGLWLLYGLVLAFIFASTYRDYRFTHTELEQYLGWWTWHDQSHYLNSAKAFASGSLASTQHHYPFGYPLLAAPFSAASMPDPFFPINLASFLALAWALVALARQLGLTPLAGVLAFICGVVLPRELLSHYVIPWTTTPVSALLVSALFLYAKSINDGLTIGRAIGLGALFALVAAIRPVDALTFAPVLVHLAWREWREGVPRGERLSRLTKAVLAGGGTAVILLLAYVFLHLSVHGVGAGSYLSSAGKSLLQPDLVPLRFLLLFNNPREIYGEGTGIFEVYPLTIVGFFGLAYTISFGRHKSIGLAVVVSLAVYLSFIDFLPANIWRYGNVHYLKWMFPVLALLSLWALKDAISSNHVVRLAGVSTVVFGLCLVGVGAKNHAAVVVENHEGRTLLVKTIDTVPIAAIRFSEVKGSFETIYLQEHQLEVDGVQLRHTLHFKAVPSASGASLVIHKPRRFGHARVQVGPGSQMLLGGVATSIEPVVVFNNPVRCKSFTLLDVQLCRN